MKKKLVLFCLIGIALVQGAFATGTSEKAGPVSAAPEITTTAPDEKVTLRFSWWGSDTRHKATLEAIKLYEQRHPNVTIEGEYGAFGTFYQKLLTQLSGKTAPDIISVDYKWVSDLINQGTQFVNMYDLKDYIDMSGFDMGFAKIYGGNDKYLIGIPVAMNGMGYLYNVDFMKKYGVEPSNAWTWDDIIANGKKVHQQDPTKYLMYNNADHWGFFVKTYLKQLNGNTILNNDYSLGFTKEDITKVFEKIKEMVDTGTVPPFTEGVLYESVYADQNPNWLNQEFGVFPTSSSLVPGIAKASGFPIDSFRYPIMEGAKDPGILVTPAVFFTIYKGSKHQDIAADFINFMLNDPEAIAILKDTRGIPCNSKARDILTETNIISPIVSQMVTQAVAEAGIAENGPSLNPEVVALIQDYTQQVGFGKIGPDAAADKFMKDLTDLVKTLK
jgi:oligogalacturonide transport system substrate-binding protein